MECYPILIPTLCRAMHFIRCVESLAANKFAKDTELVVGLDYPLNASHVEGYQKIQAYLQGIQGFGKVTIFAADQNLGATKNLLRLREYAFSKYDAIICTEDDNEFSPCFLEYMNQMLDLYKNDNSITSVCGYNNMESYSAKGKDAIVLSHDTSAWGVGLWKCKEQNYLALKKTIVSDILFSTRNAIRILRTYPTAIQHLLTMVESKVDYGDTQRTCLNIVHNTYQIRPLISMVRNWGNDGSGEHCGRDTRFEEQYINISLFYAGPAGIVFPSKYHQFVRGLGKNPILALVHIVSQYVMFRIRNRKEKYVK